MRAFVGDDFGSERSFSRYWVASQTIRELAGEASLQAALAVATRPNGSLNIAELRRQAGRAVARYVDGEPGPPE